MGQMRRPAFVAAVVAVGVTLACGPARSPGGSGQRCPDLAKIDEVGAFDYAREYALSKDATDELKAAALATAEVNQLSERLDGDLGIACSTLARDLGASGDWHTGADACAAAAKAVHDTRAKLGPRATCALVVAPPSCLVDPGLATKCAAICDASVPSEKIKSDCAEKSGRCDGNCEGTCVAKGPLACAGLCTGTCDGPVKGPCGGHCKGTCDGRPSNGAACAGICVGTCEGGPMIGDCKGKCTGACKPKTSMICDGTCGACSVALSDPKCTSAPSDPAVSSDCQARCQLAVMSQTECSEPLAGVVVQNAQDRGAQTALESAINKSIGPLLKVLAQAGEKGAGAALTTQAVIGTARNGFKDMAASGGSSSAAESEAQMTKCFDAPFKSAADASGALKALLDSAASIRDDVSK